MFSSDVSIRACVAAVSGFACGLLGAAGQAAAGDHGLRVATWNITFFGGGNTADIQNVVYGEFEGRSMRPDIILLQEMESSFAVQSIVTSLNGVVGGPGDWAAVPFISSAGSNIQQSAVYRTGIVDHLQTFRAATGGGGTSNPPRDSIRHDFSIDGYQDSSTILTFYNVHMKAGSGSSDQNRRQIEASRIVLDINTLPADRVYVIGGDFNIQSSNQQAFQTLLNSGGFNDPINTLGSWNNSFTFRFVHTQDPAGQMDDRYDILLMSDGFNDGVGVEYNGSFGTPYSTTTWNDPNHSYRSWGNDIEIGDTNRYNQRMFTGSGQNQNRMVGASIAQSIINLCGSNGHAPVFLDMLVPAKVDVDTSVIDLGTVDINTPLSAMIEVANGGDTTRFGDGILPLEYTLESTGPTTVPIGTFVDAAGGGANSHEITIDTSNAGPFSGSVFVLSSDVDTPTVEIMITGTVVDPIPDCGLADIEDDGDIDVFDLIAFLQAFDPGDPDCDGTIAPCSAADVEPAGGDGVVDVFDLIAFLQNFDPDLICQ